MKALDSKVNSTEITLADLEHMDKTFSTSIQELQNKIGRKCLREIDKKCAISTLKDLKQLIKTLVEE